MHAIKLFEYFMCYDEKLRIFFAFENYQMHSHTVRELHMGMQTKMCPDTLNKSFHQK